MTNRELIKVLKKLPKDAPVKLCYDSDSHGDVEGAFFVVNHDRYFGGKEIIIYEDLWDVEAMTEFKEWEIVRPSSSPLTRFKRWLSDVF